MYLGWFFLQILLVRQDQKLKIIIIYIFVGSWAKKRGKEIGIYGFQKKKKLLKAVVDKYFFVTLFLYVREQTKQKC